MCITFRRVVLGPCSMPECSVIKYKQCGKERIVFCQYSAGQTRSRLTWLARMSYSISPPVMSKPINSTFFIFVSSLAMGLHDMSNSFHQYSFYRLPKGLSTLRSRGCALLLCWRAGVSFLISMGAAGST